MWLLGSLTLIAKGAKDQLINAMEREIRRLEGEVLFLRNRVSQLTPLALPRGRWWWLFGGK